jgi:HEAT repeat protein
MSSEALFRLHSANVNHPDYHVRIRTATALGQGGDLRAIPLLIDLLGQFDPRDEASRVEVVASAALVRFGKQALDPLIQALAPQSEHPNDAWRRYWIAVTLGYFRDQRAIAALIDVLQDSERDVVEGAAEALARLGADEALGPVQQALSRFKLSDGAIYTTLSQALAILYDRRNGDSQAALRILWRHSDDVL